MAIRYRYTSVALAVGPSGITGAEFGEWKRRLRLEPFKARGVSFTVTMDPKQQCVSIAFWDIEVVLGWQCFSVELTTAAGDVLVAAHGRRIYPEATIPLAEWRRALTEGAAWFVLRKRDQDAQGREAVNEHDRELFNLLANLGYDVPKGRDTAEP